MNPNRPLFLLLILGVYFSSMAQLPDSIFVALNELESEQLKADWLIERAEQNYQDYPQLAYQLLHQARTYAVSPSEQLQSAKVHFLLGKIHTQLLQYDSALYYLSQSQAQFEEGAPSKALAACYLALQSVHSKKYELKTAMEYALQASTAFGKLSDNTGLAEAYQRIADIHFDQREFEKSLDYCTKAEQLLEEGKYLETKGHIHLTRGYVLLLQNFYELALEEMTKAIEHFQQAGSPKSVLASAINGRGNVYKHMERYEGAIRDYQDNLAISEALNFKRGIMISYANIGHTLVLDKKYNEALPYILGAKEAMEQSDDRSNLWEQYMHLTTIYEALGDYPNAFKYHQLYNAENETYYEDKIAQLESEIQTKYETGQREATIVLQQQKIDQQRTNQLLMIGLVSLLGIILALVYYNFRNKKRLNAALEKKNQEKELLLKEIHHRVKNNLQTISSLLNLQSAHIKDEKVLGAVTESKNRVRSMALIHQKLYQGKNLAAIEMKAYLENLCENMLNSVGKNAAKVTYTCPMNELELDVDTAIPIGLITNELLTNALKYAFPDGRQGKLEVSLTLAEDQESLRLVIADDGVGFDPRQAPAKDEWRSNFGSQLINLLSRQLEGTVEHNFENGYKTSIRFKKFKCYWPEAVAETG